MPVVDFPALRALLVRDGRLMALDVGSKTIGIATSDVLRMLATPLTTLKRGKLAVDLAALAELAKKYEVKALAVGLPLNMDGSEGPRVQSTRAFMRNLAPILPLPHVFFDERLSTAVVTRALIEADASRARRGELVDKLAAAYILQGCLDVMRNLADADADDDPEEDSLSG